MASVLISPRLHSHPSIIQARGAGVGAWLGSVLWLSRNGRAEEFPRTALREFGATPKIEATLIRERLWVDLDDEIGVPQWVTSRWSRWAVQLWKFGPLDTIHRPKIPRGLRQAVYERDGYRCVECRVVDDLTLDHIWPWSRGGEDTFENLRTLCRPCNSRKGSRV